MTRECVCAICGLDFISERTEEAALAEMEETFGPLSENQRVRVCENCYQDFMQWYRNRPLQ